MPVTHGVAGSSPVRTARSLEEIQGFFFYIISETADFACANSFCTTYLFAGAKNVSLHKTSCISAKHSSKLVDFALDLYYLYIR